jgi:tRNA-modifying protein YgfZ
MNIFPWQDHLTARGVVIPDNWPTNFGQPGDESGAAAGSTVLCDLSSLGLIEASGEDALPFLQGQFTCDMRKVIPGVAQFGGYCSPKGRLLAVFLVWQASGSYLLQLPGSIRNSVHTRLGRFVLRSKVKLIDAGETSVRLGIAGPAAETALAAILGPLPEGPLCVRYTDGFTAIRHRAGRFELVLTPERAAEVWDELARHATPAGAAVWDWLEIREGIPVVFPATQEQFVPQMANLDLLGGVSFDKGCYPGQEIVARTRYLGTLKRRMYLAHVDATSPPMPGENLFSPETGEQSSGVLVNAAPAPCGGYDILAVIQISSVEANEVHLGSPEGPLLVFEPLPYAL